MDNTWTTAEDEVLIDFVKSNECLYNVKARSYRNQQLKERLWKEVGDSLHKTGLVCSKRWSYVRDYYIRRRGKQGTGSTSEAAKRRSENLSFLDSCPSGKRCTVSNIEEPGVDESLMENLCEADAGSTDNTEYELQFEDCNNSTRTHSEKIEIERSPFYESKSQSVKSKKAEERLKLLRERAEKRQKPDKEPDENDLFFNSMAKIIKKLPQKKQAILRLQIANMVGQAEIAFLSGTDDNRPTSSESFTPSYECKYSRRTNSPSTEVIISE